jgi:hypothetical protein
MSPESHYQPPSPPRLSPLPIWNTGWPSGPVTPDVRWKPFAPADVWLPSPPTPGMLALCPKPNNWRRMRSGQIERSGQWAKLKFTKRRSTDHDDQTEQENRSHDFDDFCRCCQWGLLLCVLFKSGCYCCHDVYVQHDYTTMPRRRRSRCVLYVKQSIFDCLLVLYYVNRTIFRLYPRRRAAKTKWPSAHSVTKD